MVRGLGLVGRLAGYFPLPHFMFAHPVGGYIKRSILRGNERRDDGSSAAFIILLLGERDICYVLCFPCSALGWG